jgi:hypothetical protein
MKNTPTPGAWRRPGVCASRRSTNAWSRGSARRRLPARLAARPSDARNGPISRHDRPHEGVCCVRVCDQYGLSRTCGWGRASPGSGFAFAAVVCPAALSRLPKRSSEKSPYGRFHLTRFSIFTSFTGAQDAVDPTVLPMPIPQSGCHGPNPGPLPLHRLERANGAAQVAHFTPRASKKNWAFTSESLVTAPSLSSTTRPNKPRRSPSPPLSTLSRLRRAGVSSFPLPVPRRAARLPVVARPRIPGFPRSGGNSYRTSKREMTLRTLEPVRR